MTTAFKPVTVRFTLGSYFFVTMSVIFLISAWLRYGHTFWWVYLLGAILGAAVIPLFFFRHAMKQEYYIHHEIHTLDDSFSGESTDGSVALSEDPASDSIQAHIAYTQYMGSLSFREWLTTAFSEGIGRVKLTFKDSVLPVYRQTGIFGIVAGMVVANIFLVTWIVLRTYIFSR